jgi:hydrogenase expression/formation protein HypE
MIAGACPVPITDHKEIVMGHGSGGRLTQQLIERMVLPAFDNPLLNSQHDGAIFEVQGARLAFSADSYVVDPIFFPGGDIGELAVNGTVNDIAMCGARPLYLSVSLILEEGLPMADLWRVLSSMRDAAARAGVSLVTGDTKVVDRGKGHRVFINTSGIGAVRPGVNIDPSCARPGDIILLSGAIAAHGMAIMSVRENLEFEAPIESDTAPLHGLVESMLDVSPAIRVLRDPTRGGVASALNEIASKSGVGIRIRESSVPIREDVQGACEILGLDPLYVANEGKLIAFVPPGDASRVLEVMRKHPDGRQSVAMGEVVSEHPSIVVMQTRVGGSRVVDLLSGEQLPRIC